MSLTVAPNTSMTFTVKSRPNRTADRKTIQRLMRMQPEIQKGLKKLARRRRQKDNNEYIRAGKWWTDRTKATRLTRVEAGETFTIHVTPQIVADINSVAKFLDGTSA